MDLTTYAGLQSAIADWLMREDLEAQIPAFITLAEAGFSRRIRSPEMVTRADTEISSQYFAGPEDLLEVRRFSLTNLQPARTVEFMSMEQLVSEQHKWTWRGHPRYYTLQGRTLQILPAPDDTYTAELVYYAHIPALTEERPVNWLLRNHPDVYLYGALVESAPFLKEDERVATWGQLRDDAIRRINEDGQRAEYSRGPIRVRAKPL